VLFVVGIIEGPLSAILELTRAGGSGLGAAALRQRVMEIPGHNADGRRLSTRERVRRAREDSPEVQLIGAVVARPTTPEASGSGARPGSRRHPINVLSSPSSPEVRVASTRRAGQSSARTRIVRHSAERAGIRARLNPPVSPATLYLTAERPPDLVLEHDHHMCSICLGVKSHPVS
jgi:hypothetical protein